MEVLKLETWEQLFDPEVINLGKVQEYLDFVVQAVERYDPRKYSEWHHVMPKCIDESHTYDSQVVRINGHDHLIAHKILVESFNSELKRKLAYAYHRMVNSRKEGREITEEDYESHKEIWLSAFEEVKSSEGFNQKLSDAHKGKPSPTKGYRWYTNGVEDIYLPPDSEIPEGFMKGKCKEVSQETREKLSSSLKGKTRTEETRDKMKESSKKRFENKDNHPWTGKHHSDETKEKLRKANLGREVSEETRRRMSESAKKRTGRAGFTQTDESRSKISRRLTGLVCVTDEVILKRVKPEDVQFYLDLGWRKGRPPRLKGGVV